MKLIFLALSYICIGLAIFFLYPLALIWALNQLFNLGIAYTFWNWVAAVIFTTLFQGKQLVSFTKEKSN